LTTSLETVIVTGAAGYIGTHIIQHLNRENIDIIAIDNLSTGYSDFLPDDVALEIGDICDLKFLNEVFSKIDNPALTGVIHTAGLKYAGESKKRPLEFYETNTEGTLSILRAMHEFGLQDFVYSSSCSIYGNQDSATGILEISEKDPISPYGRSKLYAENIIYDQISAGLLNAVSLRYFNVIGNAKSRSLDLSPHNLLPNLYRAITNKKSITVYGQNLKTRDGTCIRDYVDVSLLAQAHLSALNKLKDGALSNFAYNLGSGTGTSVLEIIRSLERVSGQDISINWADARKGDPEAIFANIDLAKNELNWSHDVDLDYMVKCGFDAWIKFHS